MPCTSLKSVCMLFSFDQILYEQSHHTGFTVLLSHMLSCTKASDKALAELHWFHWFSRCQLEHIPFAHCAFQMSLYPWSPIVSKIATKCFWAVFIKTTRVNFVQYDPSGTLAERDVAERVWVTITESKFDSCLIHTWSEWFTYTYSCKCCSTLVSLINTHSKCGANYFIQPYNIAQAVAWCWTEACWPCACSPNLDEEPNQCALTSTAAASCPTPHQ